MIPPLPLVVFSHLRWDFVYQRPQQLLSRMAKNRQVFFIEEPIHSDSGKKGWEKKTGDQDVMVCRPVTPIAERGFCNEQVPAIRELLRQLVVDEDIQQAIVWFYTPLALPLIDGLLATVVVYDCMDELSLFLNAPPQLLPMEQSLLDKADLVFTGGPSLFRAKKDRHPEVHCFPSSVDADHFATALSGSREADDQKEIPYPRLGFYGVIDERIDLALLEALADAHPEWQIVMVGPVVKIDPASLPRRENIHYLGGRTYHELPGYLAGWDVCLLPFARNDATRFISPTKTLEYMAAQKPIVSTPIVDVAEPYGHIVYLGDTPETFIDACERALRMDPEERCQRLAGMHAVLSEVSWDRTVEEMETLLEVKVRKNRRPRANLLRCGNRRPREKHPTAARAAQHFPSDRPVVVVGAGPTGLSAAYHLGKDALLIEQNDRIGGWCRSIEENGFIFDFAGHIMFSTDPYVHEMYQLLLGDNVHWQDREAWVYSKNVYTRYPFQGSLYGLPPAVIKECIVGAIEARFGGLKPAPVNGQNGHGAPNGNGAQNGHFAQNGNGHCNGRPANGASGQLSDCCADGIAETTASLAPVATGAVAPRNFEEFIYQVWGAGIAKHFAIPYNRKIWAVPLVEMETSWLGGRVPLPDLEQMIEGALYPAPKPMGPNARFGYPLRGGFQSLMDGFLPHLKGRLRLNTRVAKVSALERTVTFNDEKVVHYESLISTMPLPVLIRQLGEEAPSEVRAAAAGLRHTSVRCVHLGIGRENLTDKHWIYYPEETVFHRIFVQGNASPHCNPPGGFGLTCEISYSPSKPLPCDGRELIDRCVADCQKVGFFGPKDPVIAACQVDLPFAYVVYDHARAENVRTIRDWLSKHNIILSGRYSEWEYYNSDHAFLAGKRAAEEAVQQRAASATASLLQGVLS